MRPMGIPMAAEENSSRTNLAMAMECEFEKMVETDGHRLKKMNSCPWQPSMPPLLA
jgi:hypothetical protein